MDEHADSIASGLRKMSMYWPAAVFVIAEYGLSYAAFSPTSTSLLPSLPLWISAGSTSKVLPAHLGLNPQSSVRYSVLPS